MPQIFDITANENTRYKRNELEYYLDNGYFHKFAPEIYRHDSQVKGSCKLIIDTLFTALKCL